MGKERIIGSVSLLRNTLIRPQPPGPRYARPEDGLRLGPIHPMLSVSMMGPGLRRDGRKEEVAGLGVTHR